MSRRRTQFFDRVARETTHCAKAVDEIANTLRALDSPPAAVALTESVIDMLVQLAYASLEQAQRSHRGH